MKRWIWLVLWTVLGTAQTMAEVPLKRFAEPAQYESMSLSPDGRYVAVTYRSPDVDNEVKLAILTSDLKKVLSVYGFGKDKHTAPYAWIGPERLIFVVYKNTGWLDKNTHRERHLVATNVDGSQRVKLNERGYTAWWLLDALVDDPRHILVMKIHGVDGKRSIMRMDTVRLDMRLVDDLPQIPASFYPGITDAVTDLNGTVRVVEAKDDNNTPYEFEDDIVYHYYKDRQGKWHRVQATVKRGNARNRWLGFGPENRYAYFVSNFDIPESDKPFNDTLGLFRLDTDTGEVALVYRHPEVDIKYAIRGPKREVIGVRLEPGYPTNHYLFADYQPVKVRQALDAAFKNYAVSAKFSRDGKLALVSAYSDRQPKKYYIFRNGKLRYLGAKRPKVDAKQMARVEPFKITARDGTPLWGLLTIPNVKNEKNLPMVVMPHGGPYGIKDSWGWNRDAQMLASRGYLVLQVNFRGSGGYGQDFEENAHRKWGREMQDDITDATLWAVRQGLADKERICIHGGSYGGYASLMAVVKEPELYKCAIPDAGVYSLPLMWKKGDYWDNPEAARAFLTDFIGDDDKELRQYSPAFHVDKIKAALFFIHGKNDVRVPIDHLYVVEQELKKIGKPYQVMVRDEGHGFTKEKNLLDQFEAMLKFLRQHIGPGAPLKQ